MTSRHDSPPITRSDTRTGRRALAGLLGLALVAPLAPTAAAAATPAAGSTTTALAAAAPTTDGLELWLPLDETAGTVAHDASGNGLDGTLTGTGGGWREGQGLTFGGSNHVDLPDDVLAGHDAVTVSADVWVDTSLTGNYFFYNLGNTAVGSPQTGDGYLFSSGNANYRASISDLAWGREQNTAKAPAGALARGVWKTITYTLGEGTGTLYEDGAQVGQNAAVTITPGDIGDGSTTANYLGKSAYAADNLFRGRMKDFRLYDRALTAAEVADLSADAAADAVAADAAALDLGDTTAVVTDLDLPAKGVGGSAVTWTTSDDGVVAADGTVTRPAAGAEPTTATLTATVSLRGASVTRTFDVTVLPGDGDQAKADAAAAALEVTNLDDVRGNLDLPTAGLHGADVAWATSSGTITPTGDVTRPAYGEDADDVILTATVTVGDATTVRELTAHVPALPEQEDLEGYLFSYFVGEGTSNGEQVYFGLSQGNDALNYQNLNDNQPVLTSELGEKGLRDPFIIRSPEGDKFYQIATDLRIYDGNGWDAAQRQGSRSIMVWESTDLVNWTDQRLVEVSPETAGNTWAPEAYYDESIGAYVVFWASKLYAEDDPGHTGDSYNRMMYATTRDFVNFSEAQVWIDPGYSVIDSTVAQDDDGTYYRFTKDERNNSSSTPCSKFILSEKSAELRSTDYDFVADCIGKANSTGPGINQGEGPTIFRSNEKDTWYLFIDEFGGRGYVPFESDSLDAADWTMSTDYDMPSRPRHGTVLPVTQAEYDRLLSSYQPDAFVESVDDVEVTVRTGSAPVLPATVSAHFADGSTGPADVTWDDVDPASYAQPGEIVVEGSLAPGTSVRARAVITVTDDVVPVEGVSVTPASLEIAVGGARQLTATVTPANASDRTITWSSDDESVVTVSATGLVSAVAAGHAMVTATTADGEHTAYVAVEVSEDLPGLVVRYALDETSGTSAANSAPDSTFGPATLTNGAAFAGADGGVTLDGTDDFVDLPDDLLAGLEDATVSLDVRIDPSQATPYFIYGLGNTSGTAGNGYLFTTGNAYRTSIATGNWTTEQTVTKGSNLARDVWKTLTWTLEDTTAVLYEDGVEVSRQENVTTDPGDIGDGTTLANYIGRSVYTSDRYLKGSVRDFRVYDRALAADEVYGFGANHTSITGAELDELKVPAIVDDASSTVTLPVVPGTDLTALDPELTVSPLARVSPENGAVQDFTEPVEYTVTGPDGSSRTWTVQAKIMNSPVLPGLYADPNIVQFGDTFYIYATTDGYEGWGGKDFYVWKSTDLVDWERSDEPFLTLDGENGNVPWASGNAWAPTIIERDGKYYFYFSGHNPTYERKTIGVAVADSPEGPFTAQPEAMITNGEAVTSGQAIDPAAFQDPETGKYYLFWGNGSPLYAELSDDMLSVKQDTIRRISGLNDFREGLFLNYRDGLYHLTYSIDDTGSENYRVGYATSTSIDGPWTYRGVILSKDTTQGILGTGHSSILNVAGTDDWYVAYHRFGMPGGNGNHRETTIDRLTFGEDGLMQTVTPTLESVEPVDVAPQPEVQLTVEATPRCLAGKVYLAVRATNAGDVPADVTLTTPFGEKRFADVAPGKNAYQSFATRATDVPSGTATVTGTATLDGTRTTTPYDVTYAATTCG
ncbi:family 43 glycosylhydrolase [Cellulosimicrobium arenosum]|uniref:Family 43 glycosylhydrolase n=1 Tax=Cellulosimicrobium arenosum TaxID=2708133 RepID=A0A927G9S1_9MICO|nr:family 43 glycosylhydrolase [Cellulosimicrobium arenosum]MBD8079469.1 family 43 glycosylhydrolase [Cellulosimicrobium arenosum]